MAVALTVMVAVTGTLELFIPLNALISPVPLAAKPIEVLLLVQVYVEPVTVPVKFIAEDKDPLHKTWLAG